MSTETFPRTNEEIADLMSIAKQKQEKKRERKEEKKVRELLRNLIEKFNEMLKALMQHKLVTLEILDCSATRARKAIQLLNEEYPDIDVDDHVVHYSGNDYIEISAGINMLD